MKMGARCLPTIFLLTWSLCRETKGSSDPCDNKYRGQVPNPNDPTCTTYINCWNYATSQIHTCGKFTHTEWTGWSGGWVNTPDVQKMFNPDAGISGYCDWPWDVDCNGNGVTQPGTGPPNTVPPPGRCIQGGSIDDMICDGR